MIRHLLVLIEGVSLEDNDFRFSQISFGSREEIWLYCSLFNRDRLDSNSMKIQVKRPVLHQIAVVRSNLASHPDRSHLNTNSSPLSMFPLTPNLVR